MDAHGFGTVDFSKADPNPVPSFVNETCIEDLYLGDGRNLYSYVRNNPLRYVDPSGYCKKKNVFQAAENRNAIENASNKAENFQGFDQHRVAWYAEILEDGRQLWAQVRNGTIFDAGINEIVQMWNEITGFKK